MTTATQADLMDAARAAGLKVALTKQKNLRILDMSGTDWHPLTNADQRELLAEKCGMEIDFNNKGPKGSIRLSTGHKVLWPSDAPSFPHAIVRAAAMHWRARK